MLIRDFTIGEFRGNFPIVTVDPRVDINALTAADTDPFFITLPVARAGEISSNGLSYDEELMAAIQEQMVGRGGIMGHIKDEERNTAFPIDDIDWVGAARFDETLWGKAYVPPGEAREYIRRLKARGGSLATSIYGPYAKRESLDDNSYRLRGFRLESLDLAPADRAALQLGGEFTVTAQMSKEEAEPEDVMPTKEELIAELVVDDLPQSLREAIVKDYTDMQDTDKKVAEIAQQRDDALTLVSELQGQLEKFKAAQFEERLDDRIAELVDWKVTGEESIEKVASFKRTLRSRIVSELGDEREEEKVAEATEEVWKEMKPLAEILRDALAGGPAIVRQARDTRQIKLDDSPEARRKARAKLGL